MPRSLLIIDEFQEFFTEEDRISQSAAVLLDRIVRQGRAFGIHVILGSQTLGGAYTLARATIGQMVIRIALQCNEADAYLIMDENNPAPRLLSRPGEGIYNDPAGAVGRQQPVSSRLAARRNAATASWPRFNNTRRSNGPTGLCPLSLKGTRLPIRARTLNWLAPGSVGPPKPPASRARLARCSQCHQRPDCRRIRVEIRLQPARGRAE